MNFSIEGIDNVVDKLTQYASGDKNTARFGNGG